MRKFKIIGALIAVLVFSAVAVATATAAETLWTPLPGTPGETFTGKSGEAKLSSSAGIITCKESSILLSIAGAGSSELLKEGEVNKMATLALVLIHFGPDCNIGGVKVESLGDEPGIILVHLHVHFCMISPTHFGLLFKLLPLHIEVLALKLLLSIEGSVVGLIVPLVGDKKHFEIGIKTVKGEGKEQEHKLCEGGIEDKLTVNPDETKAVAAFEEAKEGLLLFDGTLDKEGEELMVK